MSEMQKDVEIALLQKEVSDLKDEVHTLSKAVSGLVDAWKTANGVVSFIKWLSGLTVAWGVIWTAFQMKIGA